ncbi:unnamed protein product [Toxocara canis]|uniref:Transposase n=1 Tax=Toxocara canis TaxID=6265 RepID=A0A183VDV3_TOXCA|nr:unnamed protein product [Toxocara canis]
MKPADGLSKEMGGLRIRIAYPEGIAVIADQVGLLFLPPT